MRWLLVGLMLAGCGGGGAAYEPNPGTPGRNKAWSGTVTSTAVGLYGAGLYIRQDDDGGSFEGSYLAGRGGFTGAVSGSFDGSYVIHIRPTSCDGAFDGTGRIDGGLLEFSYSGSSCFGIDTGSGVLQQDYDLPAH